MSKSTRGPSAEQGPTISHGQRQSITARVMKAYLYVVVWIALSGTVRGCVCVCVCVCVCDKHYAEARGCQDREEDARQLLYSLQLTK